MLILQTYSGRELIVAELIVCLLFSVFVAIMVSLYMIGTAGKWAADFLESRAHGVGELF